GLALLYNERWAEAEEHLRRVTELAPNFGDAYARLVVCLAKLGRIEEAEAVANQGLVRAPDNPELPRLREQLQRLRSQSQ
ncbi:MAG: tetratricopeptide repeat protein, partial [Armatimonadetes bacterium]|nr:tetratricopeptide repeat protein [Armatimonadota bacterium]